MPDKNIDPQVVMTTMMGVIESTLAQMSGVPATDTPKVEEKDIVEYDGKLRVNGVTKFDSPSYISVVNYYLTPADMERHKAVKGAAIVYIDVENAGKLFKALKFPFNDDEDDASMKDCCGEFCNLIGGGFKNEVANLGYVNLIMSPPRNYRSYITEGVEYSTDQKKLFEFSFFYWKRKAIVVELTLAGIPMKR